MSALVRLAAWHDARAVPSKAERSAELAVEGEASTIVALDRVVSSSGDDPEGIAIGAAGRLRLVTEGKGMLRKLRLGG